MKVTTLVDLPLLACLLLLSSFGAAVILSVAPNLFPTQVFFYLLGLGLYFLFSRIDYRIYKNLSRHFYVLGVLLLILTLILGSESRGATRWIVIGSFQLQFSEILKPIFVLALASFFSEFRGARFTDYLKALFLSLLPMLLVFKQPDLGTAIVYLSGFALMVFASGASLLFLGASILVALILAPVGWYFLADYQRTRLLSFIAPNFDPQGASYNALQAVITVGSGMMFGKGLGLGTQSQLAFLPEKHTDFIFATLAEEFGFMGGSILLLVYFFLLWRIFSAVTRSHDLFATLILIGLGTFLLTQVFINAGMNLGILPITGITLPLFSYGGSSILATMVSLGITDNVLRSIAKET